MRILYYRKIINIRVYRLRKNKEFIPIKIKTILTREINSFDIFLTVYTNQKKETFYSVFLKKKW